MILISIFSLMNMSVLASVKDCSEAYGIPTQCEQVACSEKYQTFLGTWSGPFESYSRELSTPTEAVFRPYQNEITYAESDCLKNILAGDTFIIGRRTDVYPEFRGLAAHITYGSLITGRKSDGQSPEMTFTTIDGQDFLEKGSHKRNVTVTMSLGSKQSPFWDGVIVKGSHTLSKGNK